MNEYSDEYDTYGYDELEFNEYEDESKYSYPEYADWL